MPEDENRLLHLSETNYQREVLASAKLSGFGVHWDARENFDYKNTSESEIIIVKSRLSFFLKSLTKLFQVDMLIISDFRSFTQVLLGLLAVAMNKELILAEDGIISQVADKYNYRIMKDGGIGSLKIHFILILSNFFNCRRRITTTPNFLNHLGKGNLVFAVADPSGGVSKKNIQDFNVTKNYLVYIGSNYDVFGIEYREVIASCEFVSSRLAGGLKKVFIVHPNSKKNSVFLNAIENEGWSVYFGLTETPVINCEYLVSFNSTSILSNQFSASQIVLLRPDWFKIQSTHIVSAQNIILNTIAEVIKYEKKVDVVII